jgi:hypothetical protein
MSGGRLAGAGRGNIIDQLVKQRAGNSWLFKGVQITGRGHPGVDFSARGILRGHRSWDLTTQGQRLHHLDTYPGARLIVTN